jgi:hypothetical protein
MDFHIPTFDDPEAFKGVLNAASEFYFRSLQELVGRLRADLKNDEHLEILHHQTGKPISVHTVEYPGSQEIVLGGTTADGGEVHNFSHVAGLELEVKVVRVLRFKTNGRIWFHLVGSRTPSSLLAIRCGQGGAAVCCVLVVRLPRSPSALSYPAPSLPPPCNRLRHWARNATPG